ncbi:hypothetical protein Droror1_Dr00003115 [Drosera rotundifolia]
MSAQENAMKMAIIDKQWDTLLKRVQSNPQSAMEPIAWGSTYQYPLHLVTSMRGFEGFVTIIASCCPASCFLRDQDGRNPLHLAVVMSQIPALKALVSVCPGAAKERVKDTQHQTILHLCVSNNQPEALEFLIESMGLDLQFINSIDGNGNNIIHVAMIKGKWEVFMSYLYHHLHP